TMLIDNFLGYNAGRDVDPATGLLTTRGTEFDRLWVGDLILECEAELAGGAETAVVLELSKGINRFRATFADGKVTLERTGPGGEAFKKPPRPCKVTAGRYKLRFANVDCRLWVWVDGKKVDFGEEGEYQPVEPGPGDGTSPEGWVKANDIDAPARLGAKGHETVRSITLH